MKLSLQLYSNSLMLGMACLLTQAVDGAAQTVLAVNEVRVVSTTGLVTAKSVDGKSVTNGTGLRPLVGENGHEKPGILG